MANRATNPNAFHLLRLEGTRSGLRVFFLVANVLDEEIIIAIGKELISAADVAARIDMPFILSFQGVQTVSSSLVGQLVQLNKKLKGDGVNLVLCDLSPSVKEVMNRLFGDDGLAGSVV